MKLCCSLLGGLLLLNTSAIAQTACRQAIGSVVEHRDTFTVVSIALPSQPASVAATAMIASNPRAAGAYVFSLSRLVGSDPQRTIEVLPAAIALAKEGHSSIVLHRALTWPEVQASVGHAQPQVLCAEQWLSTHAATKADAWTFVGPGEDVPSFAQFQGVGGNTSMTFHWGLPIAGYSEARNTEKVLRDGNFVTLTRSQEQATK